MILRLTDTTSTKGLMARVPIWYLIKIEMFLKRRNGDSYDRQLINLLLGLFLLLREQKGYEGRGGKGSNFCRDHSFASRFQTMVRETHAPILGTLDSDFCCFSK